MKNIYSVFPFEHYWSFYVAFTLFVTFLLVLDLGVFHKKAHKVTFKEAATWSVVWISLAFLFNIALYYFCLKTFPTRADLLSIPGFEPSAEAKKISLEFLTGFIIEKSLALDNLFIFIVVFNYLRVPDILKHRVLFYGILGALIFRAILIALGAILLQYHIVIVIFGIFLILTGLKLLFAPEKEPDLETNFVIRMCKKLLPFTSKYDGDKFVVYENGKRFFTPLMLCLIFIEFTDIVFALDSIPAIFAVTNEAFIVYTSNIFAILGLRSLYFMLDGVMDLFRFLKYGLGLVLIFVGAKMSFLTSLMDGHFPISWSLGIIVGIIGGSILLSLVIPAKKHL